MTLMPRLLTAALAAALVLTACQKVAGDDAPAADAASGTKAATPDATPESTPPAAGAEPTAAELEALEKQKAIDRVLAEQQLLEDPNGQWPTMAQASSTYATLISVDVPDRKPESATGAPDAQSTGYESLGWQPEKDGAGIEWLELGYATPINATAVRVRQITAPGAVIKIELIDETGARHTVWQGRDDTAYESGQIGWMLRTFERTEYKAQGVRLTLATNAVQGHESIDAVQLVGG
jgi:hypothetical protein